MTYKAQHAGELSEEFRHFRMPSDLHSLRIDCQSVVEGTGVAENYSTKFHEIFKDEEFASNCF
jgi:hypothetical protein